MNRKKCIYIFYTKYLIIHFTLLFFRAFCLLIYVWLLLVKHIWMILIFLTHSFFFLFRKRIGKKSVFSSFFFSTSFGGVWMRIVNCFYIKKKNFTSINPNAFQMKMHWNAISTQFERLYAVRIPFDCTLFRTINHSLTKTILKRMKEKKKIEKTLRRIRHSITFILYILDSLQPFCLFYFLLYALLFSYVHRTWFLFYISLDTLPHRHRELEMEFATRTNTRTRTHTHIDVRAKWWVWTAMAAVNILRLSMRT